jgi:hypothetical protein
MRLRFDTMRLGVPAEVFATVISSLALTATLINARPSGNSWRIRPNKPAFSPSTVRVRS